MLNIKKHSIFSREEKRDCEEYQDKGGVLAVWESWKRKDNRGCKAGQILGGPEKECVSPVM